MYRLIVTSVVCLLLVSGCSTTPSPIVRSTPPIPEANLQLAPPLNLQAETGALGETAALLIVVSGKYYELRSRFNELVGMVRARQVDKPENMK